MMIYSDICFLDFGRFGSVGWTIGGEYSRYGYNWMLDNGYGNKQQDTFCNRVDLAAGLRWYFCKKAGLWVEGGHDTGYVSAGLSYRF